jgi:hypothetical protein
MDFYKKYGFYHIEATRLPDNEVELVTQQIEELVKENKRVNNVLLKNEAWQLIYSCIEECIPIIGNDMVFYGDFVVFVRKERTDFTGFNGPHRDMPDSTSFSSTGVPGSCVVWVSLTEATPMNSCLYFLPACYDPFYKVQGLHLEDALNVNNLDKVVAIPTQKKSIVIIGHRTIHWGSNPFPNQKARITLSFTLVRPNLIQPKILFTPTCEFREGILAAMDIWYFDHRPISKEDVKTAIREIQRAKRIFNPDFMKNLCFQMQQLQFALSTKVLKPIKKKSFGFFNEEFMDGLNNLNL